jgi:hypothetical protein
MQVSNMQEECTPYQVHVHKPMSQIRLTHNKIKWISTMAFYVDVDFNILNDCLMPTTMELQFLDASKVITSNLCGPLFK